MCFIFGGIFLAGIYAGADVAARHTGARCDIIRFVGIMLAAHMFPAFMFYVPVKPRKAFSWLHGENYTDTANAPTRAAYKAVQGQGQQRRDKII